MAHEQTQINPGNSIYEIGRMVYDLDHLESHKNGGIDFYVQTFGKQILALEGKMLDIASGEGVFVRQMRERGKDIIGIDKNFNNVSVIGAAECLPFDSETFDAVFLHRLLPSYIALVEEHAVALENIKRLVLHIILQIHSVLKDRGTGFVNVTAPLYVNHKSGALKILECAPKTKEEVFIDDLVEQLTARQIQYNIQVQQIGETGNFSKIVGNLLVYKGHKGINNSLSQQTLQNSVFRHFGIQ